MPPRKSSSGRTFARYVAPFAPLALAIGMTSGGPSQPETEPAEPAPVEVSAQGIPTGITAAKCDEILDEQDCHSRFPTGCSAAAGYDPYLNYWKDQLIPAPGPTPVKYLTKEDYHKLDANIPPGLTRNNQSDFQSELRKMGEGDSYGVIGYLYYAIHSGAESSNCGLTGPPNDAAYGNVDYHIGIGFEPLPADSPAAASSGAGSTSTRGKKSKSSRSSGSNANSLQQNSVIVEMTPHMRFQYENDIWTLDNLKKVVGRQVKVVGQLIIDNEHNLPSQNCATATSASQKQTCWRASVWELHPVTSFQVCPNNSCTAESPDWMELDAATQ